MKKTKYLMVLLIIGLMTSCKGKADSTYEDLYEADHGLEAETGVIERKPVGRWVEDVYTEDTYDLNIHKPTDWTVLPVEDLERFMGKGQQIAALGDPNDAGQPIVNLFGIFKYPLEDQRAVNPNIMGTAEKIDTSHDMDSGSTYLRVLKEMMIEMDMGFIFDGDIEEVEMMGHTYGVLRTRIETGTAVVYQVYYTAIIHDYAISLVGTYTKEDGLDAIEAAFGE